MYYITFEGGKDIMGGGKIKEGLQCYIWILGISMDVDIV